MWALNRVALLVHHHLVFLHVMETCKLHPARGAGVLPFLPVGEKVSVEVVFANEASFTMWTDEQEPVKRVHVLLVLSQDVDPIEVLATELTLVGPFCNVNCLLVFLWIAFCCAALLVQQADERPLGGVCPFMHGDVGPAVARVGAMRAPVLAQWPLTMLVSLVPVMPLLG